MSYQHMFQDTEIPDAAFIGWTKVRSGRKWRRACTADTESACWAQLLRLDTPPGTDKLVTHASRDPNTDQRRR